MRGERGTGRQEPPWGSHAAAWVEPKLLRDIRLGEGEGEGGRLQGHGESLEPQLQADPLAHMPSRLLLVRGGNPT